MAEELPLVIHWDTFPLDITDPLKRFQHGRFNYLFKNEDANLFFVVQGISPDEAERTMRGGEPGAS